MSPPRCAPPLSALILLATVGCASSSSMKSWAPDADYESSGMESADDDGGGGGGFFDGFGGSDAPQAMASMAAPAPPAPPPPPRAKPLVPGEPQSQTGDKTIEAARRLVIYTGSMALMVPQTDVAIEAFLGHITGLGGYLQSRAATSVTVRIPAAEFFPVLDWLRKHGQVTDEQVNAADVTKKVFDMELRVQTATEARKRLLALLETATVMKDILAIEVEIRRLTDEIESMKGELRTLADQVSFSTLTASFYADAPAPNPYPRRTRSRFDWINSVGIERVLAEF